MDPTRATHANSLECYDEEKGALSRRATAVLQVYRRHGAMTDRQVLGVLGYSDMNSVRPRVTELLAAGMVHECGTTTDQVTGKTVRLVQATPKAEQLELI